MDPRLEAILADELGAGLPGVAGTEIRATIRFSNALVNRLVAASLPRGGAVRSLAVTVHAGNTFGVVVDLAKPAFLPVLRATLAVVRQPVLPSDPVLLLKLTGVAGQLLKLAGPMLSGAMSLPDGVRLDGDVVHVDVRALLASHGQSSHLRYAREITVTTEEGVMVLGIVAGVSAA